MADGLLTAKQVAAHLSVNERTVLRLAAEGTLPGVKVGRRWRFRKATIDAWLDDQMLGVARRLADAPHTRRKTRAPLLRGRRETR